MITPNHFTEPLSDGRTFEAWQCANGMWQAEIRNWQNIVELATTKKTMADIWRWLKDWTISR